MSTTTILFIIAFICSLTITLALSIPGMGQFILALAAFVILKGAVGTLLTVGLIGLLRLRSR